MYISQITLRNWKAYATANFDFPAPTSDKNLVLIGAPNGYGKTSLFEAIMLGMFGQNGLHLIVQPSLSFSESSGLSTSYKKFLEKTLYKGAIDSGHTSCSIKLIFVNNNQEPLEIRRVWHFSDKGVYRPNDDEVHIFEGSTRKAIGPSELRGNERSEWFKNYITQNLLPFTLAHFFMFDGENVSTLAEREMSTQVQLGIEGLLGIPMLKTLANDLRNYAENRRKQVPSIPDKIIKNLEDDRSKLESNLAEKKERLDEIEPIQKKLKESQQRLIRELASYGVSTQALLQEQFEQIKDYEKNIDSASDAIESLMLKDLALALSGNHLRKNTQKQLSSENALENWKNGKNQGDNNLERFINSFDSGMKNIDPALSDGQRKSVINKVRIAWNDLWHPRPTDCAEEILHHYLNEHERLKVIEVLENLNDLGARDVFQLLADRYKNENDLKILKDEVIRMENVGPDLDKKRKELSSLSSEIEKYNQEIGALKNEIVSFEGQIQQKNVELARHSSKNDQAAPSIRRATQAEKIALMVDEIVKQAVPNQITAIANAMTEAHSFMAHKKGLVNRIEIDEKCNVKLLNADGEDLRKYDLSAGEKQIFTQALIAAISSVSGYEFPMVVDTPLGRLDVEHRKGMLKHLAQRKHQVILLSTDTEVVGEYLQAIMPHVQKKYLVEYESYGDIGQSSVRSGYFEENGV